MRLKYALPAAAALALATPLAAQVEVAALLGVTGSSSLVNDQIVQEIELKPALAPTFFLSASLPVATRLRASLDLSYGSSSADLTESGNASVDIGSIGVLTATAALSGPLVSRLGWRLSLGILQYMPSEDTGVFRDGVPLAALFGAGLDWRQPLSERWTGLIGLRYDFHLFTTPVLETAGFSGSQQVSRFGVALGAGWVP
ncbi:MAG TPA: hypothetical protein PKA66_04675 [Gemmatimonadales bacterium]|nr:hypothetical protein [Gemmatimonadales bacterium]